MIKYRSQKIFYKFVKSYYGLKFNDKTLMKYL